MNGTSITQAPILTNVAKNKVTIKPVQKERQKSQLNMSENNLFPKVCTNSLIPNLVISRMKKAARQLTANVNTITFIYMALQVLAPL